jgi:hypothetical protein
MKVVDAIAEILRREGVEFLSAYPTRTAASASHASSTGLRATRSPSAAASNTCSAVIALASTGERPHVDVVVDERGKTGVAPEPIGKRYPEELGDEADLAEHRAVLRVPACKPGWRGGESLNQAAVAPSRFAVDGQPPRSLGTGIMTFRHCSLQTLIDGQELQSLEFAPGEDERGEVDRVQGAQHAAAGDLTRQCANAAGDLPHLAPGPDRGDVSLGIGEPILPSDTEGAQPDERAARLHEGKTRGHEDTGRPNPPLDLRPGSALERCPEDRRRVEIQDGARSPVRADRREPRRATGPPCRGAARAP